MDFKIYGRKNILPLKPVIFITYKYPVNTLQYFVIADIVNFGNMQLFPPLSSWYKQILQVLKTFRNLQKNVDQEQLVN